MQNKVALYARVSTNDKKQDAANQLQPMQEFAARFDWPIHDEYIDEISAVKQRPSFERLLGDASERRFTTIMVWKIDRFSRSMADFVLTMLKLDAWKIRFICSTQGIDTDQANPGARLLMNMLVAVAEFERALISERVKAGIARRKKSGKPVGRQTRVMNLDKIQSLMDAGLSTREIAEQLKEPSATIIRRVRMLRARQNTTCVDIPT